MIFVILSVSLTASSAYYFFFFFENPKRSDKNSFTTVNTFLIIPIIFSNKSGTLSIRPFS